MYQDLHHVYPPGTQLIVGSHQVLILKYLTSGGFAQIYSVEISSSETGSLNLACLKRVVVPNKLSLNTLRAEVDAMKLLKNNKHVVSYIDSHASKSINNDGSYEVFLLMEYCEKGGLIDFMNTRLQNRLKEHEILDIMCHVSTGIAAMHMLNPPLIHRDIKIENILINQNGDFKVCDFGSVSGVIRPPKNAQELSYVQHDILKNTTAQYRSPEMIDLCRGFSIDEKSDIWALGVFLYKLCYYTTPFENTGELAILHSQFKFPAYPQYSDKIKNLINALLRENPAYRPNICQVLEEVSRIQGVPCPIQNFYLARAIQKDQLYRSNHSVTGKPVISSQQSFIASNDIQMTPSHVGNSEFQLLSPPLELKKTTSHSLDPFEKLDKSKFISPLNQPNLSISRSTDEKSVQNSSRALSSSSSSSLSVSSNSSSKTGRGSISRILSVNKLSGINRCSNYFNSEIQTQECNGTSDNISYSITEKSVFSAPSEDSMPDNYVGKSTIASTSIKLENSISSANNSRRESVDSLIHGWNSLNTKYATSSPILVENEIKKSKKDYYTTTNGMSHIFNADQLLSKDNTIQCSDHKIVPTSYSHKRQASIERRVQDLLKDSKNVMDKQASSENGAYLATVPIKINQKDKSLKIVNGNDMPSTSSKSVNFTQTSNNISQYQQNNLSNNQKPITSKPKVPLKPQHLKVLKLPVNKDIIANPLDSDTN